MALYLVRKKVGQGGNAVLNDSDSAIVVAASVAAARIVAGTNRPGGAAAWGDADAELFSEAIVGLNNNIIRFKSTSDTPRPWVVA